MSGNIGSKHEEWPMIGIDLGTTYSCVAIWRHGRVEVIVNDQGNRTTPSWVAFTDTQRLIGEGAKNLASTIPSNTIFDTKRLIGRSFDDDTVQKDITVWPFKVIGSEGSEINKPIIEVNFKGETKQFSPEEISAMILSKMKGVAEAFLGTKVKNAVVTVPAYFNDIQRQSTKDAAVIAGFNFVRIINEPTAAAFAYGLAAKGTGKNILVFDLGGGTFDVSLIAIDGDNYEVKGVTGNSHLGGRDFDNRILDYCLEEFKRKHGKDVRGNARALGRLRDACERAKMVLSASFEAAIVVDYLIDGIDFSLTLSRFMFEKLNMDLFEECIQTVAKCLTDLSVNKSDIDDIVVVGGSTRIPKVQKLLQELFNGKELCRSINPDEAVAFGAAIHAATLCGVGIAKDVVLTDVTPLSLGFAVINDELLVVIPKNTAIPTTLERITKTSADNQTSAETKVYQGERLKASANYFLGEFSIDGIPPAPKGATKFKTTFTIDVDGILTVVDRVEGTSNQMAITITNYQGRLTEQEIERMVKRAEELRAEDEAYVKRKEAESLREN